MKREILVALRMAAVTLVLTGVLYPLAMTGLAQILFPEQANGSLVRREGRVVGSSLIGQRFESPAYFHGRPSAAGTHGYDATASAGSNLGPTSARLRERVRADAARLALSDSAASGLIPLDLVAASGSGLDPHVSLQGALWQAPRVAAARGVPLAVVEGVVRAHLEARALGFLGEPRVNVFLLNLDLDASFGARAPTGG